VAQDKLQNMGAGDPPSTILTDGVMGMNPGGWEVLTLENM